MSTTHPAMQGERDGRGQLRPGHTVGATTRWQPGQSGNPGGRKPGVVYVSEYLATMADWSRQEVEAVLASIDTPITKRIAARRLLGADSDDARQAGADFDRIADRTEGRPYQSTTVRHEDSQSREQVLAEARREIMAGASG